MRKRGRRSPLVNDNYKSALLSPDRMRGEFEEQVRAHRMIKTTFWKAGKEYGDRLAIASLALIEEKEGAFRIIHDATHKVLVNHKIKVRDQEQMPGPEDVKAAVEAICRSRKEPIMCLVFDVSKAHRRICVDKRDWGTKHAQSTLSPGTAPRWKVGKSTSTRSEPMESVLPLTGGADQAHCF